MIRDEVSGKIMKEFVALIRKIYSYAMDESLDHKKAKLKMKCVIK